MILSKNKGLLAILVVASALLFMNSCKSKKIVTTGGTLKSKTPTELISDALSSQLDYRTISTKGSIEFAVGNSSRKSSAVYKVIKDSLLQVSVRPILGMEAFRITFTPDRVIIIDRLKKQYIDENYNNSSLKAHFDFNFYNLQAMLTNQLFIPGKKEIEKSDYQRFNVTPAMDVYMLQTKDKADISYNFAVDASDRIVSTTIYNKKKNFNFEWTFHDFIKDERYIYPTVINSKIDAGKKRVNVSISYNKLDINKNLDVDTSIPSGYEKISISKMMDSYLKSK